MNDSEKMKELEAMIVVLAKRICQLDKKMNSSVLCLNSDSQWLNELKKEATKIKT